MFSPHTVAAHCIGYLMVCKRKGPMPAEFSLGVGCVEGPLLERRWYALRPTDVQLVEMALAMRSRVSARPAAARPARTMPVVRAAAVSAEVRSVAVACGRIASYNHSPGSGG